MHRPQFFNVGIRQRIDLHVLFLNVLAPHCCGCIRVPTNPILSLLDSIDDGLLRALCVTCKEVVGSSLRRFQLGLFTRDDVIAIRVILRSHGDAKR